MHYHRVSISTVRYAAASSKQLVKNASAAVGMNAILYRTGAARNRAHRRKLAERCSRQHRRALPKLPCVDRSFPRSKSRPRSSRASWLTRLESRPGYENLVDGWNNRATAVLDVSGAGTPEYACALMALREQSHRSLAGGRFDPRHRLHISRRATRSYHSLSLTSSCYGSFEHMSPPIRTNDPSRSISKTRS